MVAASIGARPCRRQDERGADGIALVRHGRGAAAARARGLGRLADLDLHHQRDVARGLGQRADDQRGVLRQGRDAHALGEPGCRRQLELQALGQRCHHRLGLLAQRRQAARGAAELHDLRLLEARLEAARGAADVRGPARDLLAERQRRRRLQQGAAEHRRAAMLAREVGEGVDDGVELLQQRRQRLAELQHHRGVDDVLAGGAPVDVARGLGVALGDLVGQRLDHRHGERGGAARRLDELRGIVERRIAGLDDDRRHAFGDQPGFGDGLRQRRLEAQHVAQRGQVGEGLGGEHRGAERVDQTACHVSWP